MKRIVCLVLAVMMLAGVCGVAAESTESKREQTLAVLEKAYNSFTLAPDKFDLELTLYSYSFFKMFSLNEIMEQAGLIDNFTKLVGEENTNEYMKLMLTGTYMMMNAVDEDFEKWLNGEIDLKEFNERMMPVIKALLDQFKDK